MVYSSGGFAREETGEKLYKYNSFASLCLPRVRMTRN